MICKVHGGKEIFIPFGGSLIGYHFKSVTLTPEDAVAMSKLTRDNIAQYIGLIADKLYAHPPETTEVPA